MLTSSANQYLRPEYLTPLATTLDSKKSPLALLAQTCSQIGADPPSNKSSLLAPLEKSSSTSSSSTTSHGGFNKTSSKQQSSLSSSSSSSSSLDQQQQQRDKSSPSSNLHQQQLQSSSLSVDALSTAQVRSSFKPYESCLGRDKASSPEDHQQQQQQQQRAPSSNSSSGTRARTPGSGKRCSSNQSASSTRAATPQGRRTATPNGESGSRESPRSHSRNSPSLGQGKSSTVVQSPASAYSPGSLVLGMTDPGLKDIPLGTFKPGNHVPVSTSSGYLTYAPQLPIDVMASSLMSQHHAALKNGLGGNPYLGYARMKTASGAETLVPVCRDPYCTGCQLNSQLLANSSNVQSKIPTSTGPCPAGCAQCDHKPQPPPSASPYGHLGAHSPVAAAYAHAQLAALAAASQLPYVCNWISGDAAYCGKRFSTSEELLQHLRSHTSVNSGDPSAAAAALSLLSPPGLPPNHPLLSRTYPTPPLSPLATARYHPYGKPSPLMSHSLSSLGLPMPPHPHHPTGLPPYFSPYSLYGGPRLGAASGMHP